MLKDAFASMTESFKEVGKTARQNNSNFIADLPYYGVPEDSDPKKNIIPLATPSKFLDIIDVVCTAEEFSPAGKINVLKSRLLGPALTHWQNFKGATWDEAKTHLLLLFPEVECYTSVTAKIASLKHEPREQISQYASRIVQIFDTMQRLHPSKRYANEVKESDSIRKLLDVLPQTDRKWIKIDDPSNNFFEVLRQILTYCERETILKLSIEDIKREQKTKSGTFEVNNTQNVNNISNAQNQKQNAQQPPVKGQSANNQADTNKNKDKTCHYCKNRGHISSECRKKARAELANNDTKNGNQSSKKSNNGKNFEYNPNYKSKNNGNKQNLRCNFCNLVGHTIAECHNRQKQDYNNQSANNSNMFCKYCKCSGHLIAVCKKRIYVEDQRARGNYNASNNSNYSNPGANYSGGNNNDRRCYSCNATSHIARYCPNKGNNQNF